MKFFKWPWSRVCNVCACDRFSSRRLRHLSRNWRRFNGRHGVRRCRLAAGRRHDRHQTPGTRWMTASHHSYTVRNVNNFVVLQFACATQYTVSKEQKQSKPRSLNMSLAAIYNGQPCALSTGCWPLWHGSALEFGCYRHSLTCSFWAQAYLECQNFIVIPSL